MKISSKSIKPHEGFSVFCDRGILFSLCALIFVLPASIALLDSFAALAVSFYFLKKINLIVVGWPRDSSQNFGSQMRFIWKGLGPPATALNRPLRFLTLAIFISVLLSQYPAVSFFAFWGKFIKHVFVYFSLIEALRDQKRVWVFVGFLMASALIASFSGVVQHYTGRDFIEGKLIGTENLVSSQRISSSFFGANAFGVYLIPVIALTAHLFSTAAARRRPWLLRGFLTLFLALLLICLCWTYSRSAWLGYLVALFVMGWLDKRKRVLALVLFLIFIFVFIPSLSHVRNLNLASDNSSGIKVENQGLLDRVKPNFEDLGSGRSVYWKKAVSIICSSPVWGTGFNTYARIVRKDPDPRRWQYAHNCYLQLAAETGLLGLVCFVWLLFVLFHSGWEACRRIKEPWLLTVLQAALCGLFGFLVQSFLDNTFYTVQLGMLMWLIFGLIMAVIRLNHGK
jgi:putative inorganic carbon (HCO3(-)) transporter